MRIIAGEFRGRKLKMPKNEIVRPTTGRLRESIFNVISSQIGSFKDIKVADIFAGTGALGLEALSRGAAHVTFVEKHSNLLHQNISLLNAETKTKILNADARALPKHAPFDLIFLDPPYNEGLLNPTLSCLYEMGWIYSKTLLVIEHEESELINIPTNMTETRCLNHGKRQVHFYKH